MESLHEKLSLAPKRPGVYFFKDKAGRILYIGKAKVLRSRLRNHFHPSGQDPKHERLMGKVEDFETLVTDSDVEALILEANLIKLHKPRYNINLKDDKSYPYIRITNEPFPRVFVTRKVAQDGSRYFGPYTEVASMRELLRAIRRIFPVRTCRLALTEESVREGKFRACLNLHIHRCKGPCEGHIDRKEYLWFVDQLSAFIRGQNRELIRDLERRMREYSKAMRYEDAANMRDLLQSVSTFYSKQKVASGSLFDRDVLAIAMHDDAGIGVVFNVRGGKLIQRRQFTLAGTDTATQVEALSGFLEQYYMHTDDVPPEILLADQIEDLEATALWLSGKRGKKASILIPQKGGKADLTAMAAENARLILEELRLQKAGAVHHAASVLALQKDLGLSKPPMRIEAFDISNLFGQDAVASMVYFENGQPKKSQYRRFKIQTVEGIDDFKMMAEAVERRFSRLTEENGGYPDLVLVDGGKGQLSAAVEVLQRLGIHNQPVIGLAKRLEEIFRPGISDPQTLPKTSPSLHLLQRMRDEAHRFAVKYHRTLRNKDAVVSALDKIPGVGPKRRQELLKHFGSLEGVRQAGEEDLAKVKGMNKSSARKVWEALHKNGR